MSWKPTSSHRMWPSNLWSRTITALMPRISSRYSRTDLVALLAPQMLTSPYSFGINLPHRYKIQSTCCADPESSPKFLRMKPSKAHMTGTDTWWRCLAPKQLYSKTQTRGHPGHPMASMHACWAHKIITTDATWSMYLKQENSGYWAQLTFSHSTAWPPNIHPNHTTRSTP